MSGEIAVLLVVYIPYLPFLILTYTYIYYLLGLFWVPGGAFNIFAIRNAGLAISQGIVASSIVMVRHYTTSYLIYLLIYFSYSFG